MAIDFNQGGSTNSFDPTLSMANGSRDQYPNPFFDLAQQYMPPTIKELFRWCTFYYYNSPLISSTINKISRYPITDLIFEDKSEPTRDLWGKVLVKHLKIKDRLMEINLDHFVYGNAFVSLHIPFTRILICTRCKHRAPIQQVRWSFDIGHYGFRLHCKQCGQSGPAEVHDRPYKDIKGLRLIRWCPENILLKYNEYTGRRVYMYNVPFKLKNAVLRGDKDILEDIPLIVLQAIRDRRYIRLNPDNIFHVRRPTLAEQDQGWGKPLIMHVMKDMFYLYTLRRAQEAIALEHIVPFDILYPLPNAQVDPYQHTDLGSWRTQIETMIRRHRRDLNFKAVIPIPVGFGRLGGDGKAMLLTPEINLLNQSIAGGMGTPLEFVFGGLNYTGSSISLRTMENDFIQNRSQLLDLVLWLKDKIRVWMDLPDCEDIRFSDFRMADDVQRNQQLIGLNAQGKISDQTMLTELGYDYDHEVKKRIEEAAVQNYLNDLLAKGGAKSQGEASMVQFNYQAKINELAQKAQQSLNERFGLDPAAQGGVDANGQPAAAAGGGQAQPPAAGQPTDANGQPPINVDATVQRWASKLTQMDPNTAMQALQEVKTKTPQLGAAVEAAYKQSQAKAQGTVGGQPGDKATGTEPNMNPLPENGMPRRAGAV